MEQTIASKKDSDFIKGLKDGLPICIGYISVAIAFGVVIADNFLPSWVAGLSSMTTFTSAAQFAGIGLMQDGAMYIEIAITTVIVNIRYILMSLSLSQRVRPHTSVIKRLILSFFLTDEAYAVVMSKKSYVNIRYFIGLMVIPYLGWVLGSVAGATVTSILPMEVRSALGIALYGLFLAIIVPAAKETRPVAVTVIISAALSCIVNWLPFTKFLSGGWGIIFCAIVSSLIMAKRYPVTIKEE